MYVDIIFLMMHDHVFNDCSSFLTLPCSWLDVMHVLQVLKNNIICTKISWKFLDVISTFCRTRDDCELLAPSWFFLSVIYKKTKKQKLWKYHSQGLDYKLITCSPSAGQHYIHIIFAETAVRHAEKMLWNKCSPKIWQHTLLTVRHFLWLDL